MLIALQKYVKEDVEIEIIFHDFRHRVAIKNHKSFPQPIFMSVNKKMLTVNKL